MTIINVGGIVSNAADTYSAGRQLNNNAGFDVNTAANVMQLVGAAASFYKNTPASVAANAAAIQANALLAAEAYNAGDYAGVAEAMLNAAANAASLAALSRTPQTMALAIGLSALAHVFKEREAISDALMDVLKGLLDIPLDWFGDLSDFFQMNPEIAALFQQSRTTASPLVFDLDGDGIEIAQLSGNSPVLFDHDANGVKTGSAWLRSDDALLVLDRDGNGTIDSGRELFGNNTVLAGGGKAADGYAALGELDSNGDGLIDAQDARFGELKLWRDLDQDGVSDAGELFGLAELGVSQISLAKTAGSQMLGDGTRLDGSAGFTVNGETRTYTDAWFAENQFYREFTDAIPLTAEAAALPGMKGAGAVRDLREAASLDASLAARLAGMQNGGWVSRETLMGEMDALVRQWAATADFETSREKALARGVQLLFKPQGVTDMEMSAVKAVETLGIDKTMALMQTGVSEERYAVVWSEVQRLGAMLDTLEAFNGQTLYTFSTNSMSSGNGTINLALSGSQPEPGVIVMGQRPVIVSMGPNQTSFLLQSHEALRRSVYEGLVLQTRLKGYLDAVSLNIDASGIAFDFSGVDALLDAQYALNATDALVDLLELMKRFGGGAQFGWETGPRLNSWMAEVDSLGGRDAVHKALAGYSGMAMSAGSDFYVASATDSNLSAGEGDDFVVGNSRNNTLNGGGGNDILYGGEGNDTLYGGDGNDLHDGGAGNDTHWESLGDDVYLFGRGDGQDVITQYYNSGGTDVIRLKAGVAPSDVKLYRSSTVNGGNDLILSIVGTTDSIRVQGWVNNPSVRIERIEFADGTVWDTDVLWAAPVLGSEGGDTLYAVSGAGDTLRGLGGNDALHGNSGSDILEGGDGNDSLTDSSGKGLYNGGAGNDQLTGGSFAEIYLGGQGNDTLVTGAGNDVILFNKGDGQDIIATGSTGSNTLSLGGGTAYEELFFVRQSNDLILKVGESDQITFSNWYASTSSRSVASLQVIAEAMDGFSAGGSDPLRDQKVETFDFSGLADAFDSARTANPGVTSWALSNALSEFHLGGSDAAAIGGDLAYHYGRNGSLAGIGVDAALATLADSKLGTSAQVLNAPASLQTGVFRLS